MNYEVIYPNGMFGASAHDTSLDTLLREIAVKHQEDKGDWSEKYGSHVDNDKFMMRPFCWCESEDCPWCWDESEKGRNAPNFLHKSTGFQVHWYKYIGRSTEVNQPVTPELLAQLRKDCL